MNIEKLIEQLNNLEACAYGYHINGEVLGMDYSDFEQLMVEAAEEISKISTLQAENEKLRGYINDLETQHRTEMCENGYDCVELGKLRAELEQVKRERDSALKDLERLCRDDVGPCEMAICELCAYNSGVQCSSSDRQICDGYNVFNWKWRSPQKED